MYRFLADDCHDLLLFICTKMKGDTFSELMHHNDSEYFKVDTNNRNQQQINRTDSKKRFLHLLYGP